MYYALCTTCLIIRRSRFCCINGVRARAAKPNNKGRPTNCRMSYDYTKRAMSGSDFPPAGRGRPSRVWVLDGGLATELESKGHSINVS